jgi:hypothetical protein
MIWMVLRLTMASAARTSWKILWARVSLNTAEEEGHGLRYCKETEVDGQRPPLIDRGRVEEAF